MTAITQQWLPPEPTHGSVGWSRTWRVLTYGPAAAGPRLYLAVAPECLQQAYEALFPTLDGRRINHRHARSAAALRGYDAHPTWTGKGVVIDLAPDQSGDEMAALFDGVLAGQDLSGPAFLAGARPYGGRSGLLFIRREGPAEADDQRRRRLAQLLGE